MKQKKILIIHPGTLYPTVMAFQDRVLKMTQVLSETHQVDLVVLYQTEEEKKIHEKKLPSICNKYYLLPKPNRNFLQRKFFGFISLIIQKLFNIPGQMIYPNWPSIQRKIKRIIKQNQFDIIQIETWWQCSLFKQANEYVLKVVDTHDVMYEKRELELKHKNSVLSKKDIAFIKNYKKQELKNTNIADVIISISEHDLDVFKNHYPPKKHLYIPIGQDIEYFSNYSKKDDGKTILFYGSMGGEQNIIGFWRLYEKIYPQIKSNLNCVRLIVLGANPPKEISQLDNGKDIIVTGFVEDAREFISKSTVMVLPLETSGGFRGRIIETMAMGVPIIGTHNALDSVEILNDVHGYITDNDEKMAEYAIELLNNHKLRSKMGEECIKFVSEKYSIEATYGKLSKYYKEI